MLTLTICTLSPISLAISLSSGSTFLQGAHQSAQKSTSTGLSDCSTSLTKVASVTALVAPTWTSGSGKGSCSELDERGDEPLGVQCGRADGAGRGDRLPVRVVHQVAGGEHAGDVGAGARVLNLHVALVVDLDLVAEELAARVVADRDEDAG